MPLCNLIECFQVRPRIWTCVTRLSHPHVHRVWVQDYELEENDVLEC